jgi:hypothetical protein
VKILEEWNWIGNMKLSLSLRLGVLAVAATALVGGVAAYADTGNPEATSKLAPAAATPAAAVAPRAAGQPWTVDDYNAGYNLGHSEYWRQNPEPGFCQLNGRDNGNSGFALGFNDACSGMPNRYSQ